jgi:hypothetical protein
MTPHTKAELIEALRHVGYDLWMTGETSLLLDTLPDATNQDLVNRHACLESELLHARALTDFFIKTTNFKTDIRRTDFAQEWEPAPALAVQRIDSHDNLLDSLAHLTWEPVQAAQAWNYPEIAKDLADIADAWSTHLGRDRQDMPELYATFRPFVHDALQKLNAPRATPVAGPITTTTGTGTTRIKVFPSYWFGQRKKP